MAMNVIAKVIFSNPAGFSLDFPLEPLRGGERLKVQMPGTRPQRHNLINLGAASVSEVF